MDAMTRASACDLYADFETLAAHERDELDYRIRVSERRDSPVAIIAPHGGSIERRTSAIANAIAAEDFNLYRFEGLDESGSFESLHITSHRFDEPRCLKLVRQCRYVVAIHGCAGDQPQLMLGGRDETLIEAFAAALAPIDVSISTTDHPFPGKHANNICNRGLSGQGVQLEFTDALRGSTLEAEVIAAIRSELRKL